MALRAVDGGGVTFVEGEPGAGFLTNADATTLLEECFSARTRCALLYASNLSPAFFDVSSGDAGAVLQRLRNYGVRLAVVVPAGTQAFSSRFPELLAQERRGRSFNVFETRDAAIAWLRE